jgi:CMP-N-acetylneuraminic acid synthetase
MRAAKGKYIMRLDADDFLETTALEVISSSLNIDDNLGLVFPDYYYVNAEGERTGVEKRHNFEKEVSLYDQPAHGACTMIRLAFLKKLGGYNESFTCQDGYELWIKFISHYKVSNINQPLFSYRRHGNNLTTNEKKILDTRKKIKALFVEENLSSPATLGIIPVRNTKIGQINLPLFEVNGKSLLVLKIEACLKSSKITKLVVSSSDVEIIDHLERQGIQNERLSIIRRPSDFAGLNQTLYDTFDQVITSEANEGNAYDAVMSISIDYPFLAHDTIDEAIDTLTLFKSDAVMSVRPDNRMYYQHNGHSLTPILDQEKFTKLEREALYKGVGGVVLSSIVNFQKHKNLVAGSISHIVVDSKTAFGIFNSFDFEVYKALEKRKQ